MDIRRILKQAYELLTVEDVLRAAKSTWRDAATVALASRLLDLDGDLVSTPVFIGSSFEPSADGTSSLVTMKPGLGIWYDAAEGDEWLGEVKPVFSDVEQSIAFPTNTDGSGFDRIDLLVCRPLDVEDDEQLSKFKDPTTQIVSQSNSPQRTRRTLEFEIIEGTPAALPVAPATPAGDFAIAHVLRVNAQVNVFASEVTDVRGFDTVRATSVEAALLVAVKSGAVIFGESGSLYKFQRDDNDSPTRLELLDESNAPVHLRAQNTPRAQARFGWSGAGPLPNDDPADTLSGYGVASMIWKNDGTDEYAELTLSEALPSTAGYVHCTLGANHQADGQVHPRLSVGYTIVSTTLVRLYFYNPATGALVEPTDSPTGILLHSVSVYHPG